MAVPTDGELKELLDKFVCVRLVQMWGVDLHRFEFDRALTWAIFFMNADGSMYGRYGSRSGLRDLSAREISLTGFKESLRAALELHTRYTTDPQAVKPELADKVAGAGPTWRRPEEIPTMRASGRFGARFGELQRDQHGGCIHCHMVATNELKSLRDVGEPIPDRKLFPYPMPDQLGFRMDPTRRATVQRVLDGTIAARAGLQGGDRILRLAGQPILSTADIQWVLHNAGDEDSLEMELARGDRRQSLQLELPPGWRLHLEDWRFINPGLVRQMLGFDVQALPPARAARLGLTGKLALQVDRTTPAIRRQTGLGHLDLIVAVDDIRTPLTVGTFTGYVLRNKPKGSVLKITILRISDRLGKQESDIEITVQ